MIRSEGRAMIATNAIFGILSAMSLILRYYANLKGKKPGLRKDDYLMIAASAFSTALVIINIAGVPIGGFGLSYKDLKEEKKGAMFLKLLFVLQFCYVIALGLVKISILSFYGHIFSSPSRLNIKIKIMLAVTMSWLISFILATLFQIWPIRCNWMACERNSATNYPVMYILNNMTDIILDIAILCLPVSYIRNIQTPPNRKIGIGFIFGLGIFCIVSSTIRLAYVILYQKTQLRGDFEASFNSNVVNLIMWSGIEACASTICGNLPCYMPLAEEPFLEKLGSRVRRYCITPFFKASTRSSELFQKLSRGGTYGETPMTSTTKTDHGMPQYESFFGRTLTSVNPHRTPRKSPLVSISESISTDPDIFEETEVPLKIDSVWRIAYQDND